MTSDARATTLISEHFLLVWPTVAIGVPGAVDGPPTPRGTSSAHLSVWYGVTGRWIALRMWVPIDLQLAGSVALFEAAEHVFTGARIRSDDGWIVVDVGERFDLGRYGVHWMSAAQWSFQME